MSRHNCRIIALIDASVQGFYSLSAENFRLLYGLKLLSLRGDGPRLSQRDLA